VFLFKFQSSSLLVDVVPVYKLIAPHLGSDTAFVPQPYVRTFTAEAFAFLLRKASVTVQTDAIDYMLQDVMRGNEAYAKGVALVLFETVNYIDKRLHSRTQAFLTTLFQQVLLHDDRCNHPRVLQAMSVLTTLLCMHVDRKEMEPVWNVLTQQLHGVLQGSHAQIALVLHVLIYYIVASKGTKVRGKLIRLFLMVCRLHAAIQGAARTDPARARHGSCAHGQPCTPWFLGTNAAVQ
jgi:U3 small nucleolar RNA-associated protein 20